MPVTELEFAVVSAELPEPVRDFLREAESRIERFIEERLDDPIVSFVPSDFPAVYQVLRTIAEGHFAPGYAFCEWGSGFGVVAMLASMLEFDACGIEIQEELVTEAADLADAFELPVEFFCGSFLPEGAEALADRTEEFAWLDTHSPSAYVEMGVDPDDFDVIFAYPWPGEEQVVIDLFERYGAVGALLVTYQGVEEVHVRRKTRL